MSIITKNHCISIITEDAKESSPSDLRKTFKPWFEGYLTALLHNGALTDDEYEAGMNHLAEVVAGELKERSTRVRQVIWSKRMRATGRCIRCGKPRKHFKSYCDHCNVLAREYQRKRKNSKRRNFGCKSYNISTEGEERR